MNNKGVTLIELIVSIAIASILMMVAYSMFGIGLQSHKVVTKEFNEQSSIRYSIDTINTALRFSTVGFAVTEEDFQPAYVDGSGTEVVNVEDATDVTGLVKPWSYVGLSPKEDAFIYYEWVDDDLNDDSNEGIYNINVLAEAPEGVEYDITFKKGDKEDENNLVNYILKGFKDSKKTFSVQTELEALNALQIIDWGDSINRSVAFAYRTDKTPEIHERPVAALAMVIDESGSMNRNMAGEQLPQYDLSSRIALLKKTLNKDDGGLFSILEDSEAYISLIPFSYNADNPSVFYKVSVDKNNLMSLVNDLQKDYDNDAMTNTGDGLRRAYYQLVNFNVDPAIPDIDSEQEINKYLVVLVDGDTNYATCKGTWIKHWYLWYSYWVYDMILPAEYYLVDGNVSDVAEYDTWDDSRVTYVNKIGEKFTGTTSTIGLQKTFVIGYSNRPSDLTGIKEIAIALGVAVSSTDETENYKNNDSVFIANDEEGLSAAFEAIGKYINEDLWQVSGPKLP